MHAPVCLNARETVVHTPTVFKLRSLPLTELIVSMLIEVEFRREILNWKGGDQNELLELLGQKYPSLPDNVKEQLMVDMAIFMTYKEGAKYKTALDFLQFMDMPVLIGPSNLNKRKFGDL